MPRPAPVFVLLPRLSTFQEKRIVTSVARVALQARLALHDGPALAANQTVARMALQADCGGFSEQQVRVRRAMVVVAHEAIAYRHGSVHVPEPLRHVLMARLAQPFASGAQQRPAGEVVARPAAVLAIWGVGLHRSTDRGASGYFARPRGRGDRRGIPSLRSRSRRRNAVEEERQHAVTSWGRACRPKGQSSRRDAHDHHRPPHQQEGPP